MYIIIASQDPKPEDGMRSRCIVFEAPNRVKMGEIDVPKPGVGQVLTRTLYTGVSTGTETRVLRGGETAAFPLIPGYENVGEVIEVGEDVSYKPGDIVYVGSSEFTGPYTKCWGAQLEIALANADNLISVPYGLDPLLALYVKVGGIALHGIKRARVTADDRVVVVGLGLIGHLAAQSAKAFGAQVIAVDKDDERLQIAQTAGFDYVLDAKTVDVEARVKEITAGGADVAVDATGVAAAVDQTAQLVHGKPWAPPYPPSARVVLLGSYTEPVAFSYHPTLFGNEPDILPSRDVVREDLLEMMQLIAAGRVKAEILPARIYKAADAPRAYEELVGQKLMRIVFDWR